MRWFADVFAWDSESARPRKQGMTVVSAVSAAHAKRRALRATWRDRWSPHATEAVVQRASLRYSMQHYWGRLRERRNPFTHSSPW